jgi:hypothetical protein
VFVVQVGLAIHVQKPVHQAVLEQTARTNVVVITVTDKRALVSVNPE